MVKYCRMFCVLVLCVLSLLTACDTVNGSSETSDALYDPPASAAICIRNSVDWILPESCFRYCELRDARTGEWLSGDGEGADEYLARHGTEDLKILDYDDGFSYVLNAEYVSACLYRLDSETYEETKCELPIHPASLGTGDHCFCVTVVWKGKYDADMGINEVTCYDYLFMLHVQ